LLNKAAGTAFISSDLERTWFASGFSLNTCETDVGIYSVTCRSPDGNQFRLADIAPSVDMAVFVKGGTGGGNLYTLEAGQKYTGLHVPTGQAISHIEFCFMCNDNEPDEPEADEIETNDRAMITNILDYWGTKGCSRCSDEEKIRFCEGTSSDTSPYNAICVGEKSLGTEGVYRWGEGSHVYPDGCPGNTFDIPGRGPITLDEDCNIIGEVDFEDEKEVLDVTCTLTANFTMNPGYTMGVTQFYLGSEPLPSDAGGALTTDPGLYTAVHDSMGDDGTFDTYHFTNAQRDVYVVAHTTICGTPDPECECECPTEAPSGSPSAAPSAAPTAVQGFTAFLANMKETEAPITPVTLPQKCIGYSASWSGDPHMRTFDGLKYDCQGEGEFSVLKSLESDFEIQGRFVKFREKARPTVTSSLAIRTGDGEPVIQVNVPTTAKEGCTPYVYVDGVQRDIIADGVGDPSVQVQKVQTKKNQGFIIYYHKSKLQLTALSKTSSRNGCVMSAKICLPFDYERSEEKFGGLLGTPNNDRADDWVSKYGDILEIPKSRKDLRFGPAYDYCVENWCIREEGKSLFTYEDGESFEGFNHCGLPPDTETEDCVADPPPELRRICGKNNPACMVDGCVGGPEEAKKYIEAEDALVDKMCGRQIFFEDFADVMDGPWGDIYEKDDFKFLHLYKGSSTVTRSFEVPEFAELVTVEFLFYELGGWEREGQQQDSVIVTIGDTKIDLQTFGKDKKLDDFYHDVEDGITWTRQSITDSGDFGLGNTNDQMHKMMLKIPEQYFDENSILKFQLDVTMTEQKSQESAGIDDFRLVAYGKSCVMDNEVEPHLAPEKDQMPPMPDSLPVKCEARVATSWGDPHIVTFDGLKFDCQGEGEFTLAKSLDVNMESKFEVQGRFLSFDKRRITVTRGIAVREEGLPTVQLNVPSRYDKTCPVDLWVDGHKRALLDGTGVNEVVVRQVGKNIVIYYPMTRLQLTLKISKSTKYGCFLSTKLCLPDDYRQEEKIVGLLGTPDDDESNEWTTVDGSPIAEEGARRFRKAYEYCTTHWCVTDPKKSIFSYGQDESFEKFNKCGAEYEGSIEACTERPPKWLLQICSAEDFRCLFEGCAGGEDEAEIALDVEFDLNDEKGCGETITAEDFNEVDPAEWNSMIETDPRSGQKYLGRFHMGSEPVTKVFEVPEFTHYVTVEFLLFEIDDWGAKNRNMNKFFLEVGDKRFDLETFEDEDNKFHPGNTKKGWKNGIRWKRQALTGATNMGYNNKHKDQIHKVDVKIPVSIGFEASQGQGIFFFAPYAFAFLP
jgi:hypothetical protein